MAFELHSMIIRITFEPAQAISNKPRTHSTFIRFSQYVEAALRRIVSLSGCPWPAGHLCADFCAQTRSRLTAGFRLFRPHTVSPKQRHSETFARRAATIADFTQHSSDGIVKKRFFSLAIAPDMNMLATIIKMSVAAGSSSNVAIGLSQTFGHSAHFLAAGTTAFML
jgi:hypothetical protein